MANSAKAIFLRSKFGLLQLHIGAHTPPRVPVGKVKHRIVQRMESRQRDELEGITHRTQFTLEFRYLLLTQSGPPIERWGAVISQLLTRILGVNGFSEFTGKLQVGGRGFAPNQIRIWCISQPSGNSRLWSRC